MTVATAHAARMHMAFFVIISVFTYTKKYERRSQKVAVVTVYDCFQQSEISFNRSLRLLYPFGLLYITINR